MYVAMMFLAALLSAVVVALPQVTLTAPGHTPKINVHWNYVVRATEGGKPASAQLTAQIIDPIGIAHPVQFANTKKTVTNRPFKGVFRDYLIWPPSSRGVPLKLRIVVQVGDSRRTITYLVTPRA
jgi:hypothetical protein